MNYLGFLFFLMFSIPIFCQNTDDVQKISNIIIKNNKLTEDNIKKFDESTRKQITKVLLNDGNQTSVLTRNSTKLEKIPSDSDQLDVSVSLLVFTLIAVF